MTFIDYWGRRTIGLYFFCGALPNTIAIIMGKTDFMNVYACALVSLVIAIPIVYLLNRYVPAVFDLRKLKKNII